VGRPGESRAGDGDSSVERFGYITGLALERPAADSGEARCAPLLSALRSAAPLAQWPPGLAELVETFARPPAPATALLVADLAGRALRRVELPPFHRPVPARGGRALSHPTPDFRHPAGEHAPHG
jgi:hypothetical protein